MDITERFGSSYSSEFFDMITGKDGVVYALVRGNTTTRLSVIFATWDGGANWKLLKYNTDPTIYGEHLTLNRSISGSRIYITARKSGGQACLSIPDYTKSQLAALS